MRMAQWVAWVVLVGGVGGCFSPTQTNGGSETGGSSDGSGTGSGTVGTTASTITATSSDPTGDPTTVADSGTSSATASSDPTGDPTTVADSGSAGSSGDTSSPGCDAPNRCVDPAPAGWSGPGASFLGDIDAATPPCASPYPLPALETEGGLDVPAASCDCDCTPPGDAYCDGGTVTYNQNSATCDLPATSYAISDGCADFGAEYFSIRYFEFDATGVQVFGSNCTAVSNFDIPAPSHQIAVVTCDGGDTVGSCDGDALCMPVPADPFQDRLCIWQDGDLECPADTVYTVKELYFDGVSDDRECSPCSCGALAGTCTNASVTLRADNACVGASGNAIAAGGCGNGGTVAPNSASLTATPNPSCTPGGGNLGGDVVEQGPHTLCCTR